MSACQIGVLFAVGGNDDHYYLNGVEPSTGVWTSVAHRSSTGNKNC